MNQEQAYRLLKKYVATEDMSEPWRTRTRHNLALDFRIHTHESGRKFLARLDRELHRYTRRRGRQKTITERRLVRLYQSFIGRLVFPYRYHRPRMNDVLALRLLHSYIAVQESSLGEREALREQILSRMEPGATNTELLHKLEWQLSWYRSTVRKALESRLKELSYEPDEVFRSEERLRKLYTSFLRRLTANRWSGSLPDSLFASQASRDHIRDLKRQQFMQEVESYRLVHEWVQEHIK